MIEPKRFQFQFQFSRLSMVAGLFFLLTVLALVVLVIGFKASVNNIFFRLVVGLLIAELLLFFLGLIKDRLTTKLATMGFEFLAFGAIVSYVGILVAFLPLIFWIAFNTLDFALSIVLVIIGTLVFFFGYFSETSDLNEKLARSFTAFIKTLKTYEYRKGIKAFFGLPKQLIAAFLAYLARGILAFITTVKNFFSRTITTFKVFIIAIVMLVLGIPSMIVRSIRMFLRHLEIVGLVASAILIFQSLFKPLSALPVDFNLSVALFVISAVLVAVKTIYLHKERFIVFVVTLRDRTWEAGYKLNYRVKTIGEARRKITCTNCGELIPLNSRICNKCDREVERCMICKLPLKQGQVQVNCPHCSNAAHHDHWRYWVTQKGSCPSCLHEISG
ncbi:MAG: hypothetical protein ACFFD4_15645 [Candidatus Odinarchaeota archaeon]